MQNAAGTVANPLAEGDLPDVKEAGKRMVRAVADRGNRWGLSGMAVLVMLFLWHDQAGFRV